MQKYATRNGKATKILGAFFMFMLAVSTINVALAQSEARHEENESSSKIEGSWILTNERIFQGFSFNALASFTAGGVWLGTGSIEMDPKMGVTSTLHGSWKETSRNHFTSTSYFFAFDPSGKAVAMIKVNQSFQLTGQNDLVGLGFGFACDPNGNNCVSVPMTNIRITGRRIVPETL